MSWIGLQIECLFRKTLSFTVIVPTFIKDGGATLIVV